MSHLPVLTKGSTDDRIQVIIQLKVWADHIPGSFELPDHLEPRPSEGKAPNLLALALAVALRAEEEIVRIGALEGLELSSPP